ncbi:sensor domain-containing protein [Dyella sp.]|uniref:sensor domain-containing protein n=1 Tax=Dyella sp. TaxID=1869338 RepID=UPI002D794795|nr:EAL domain-containing protein [Dyella sp.]HET6431287.1 EAL domain-containing protein [Dyella sp.]
MGSAIDLGGITPILSTVSEGILLADARGHITYVNQSFTAITGFTSEDLVGTTCRAMQGPLTEPDTVQRIREAIASGRPFSGEMLNYTKGGETFWNDLTITPVFANDALSGFIGITRDSSARRDAADAQASRERLYTFLFQHVQAGIVLHRANTEIIYANETALRLLGMSHDALLGAFYTDEHFEFLREDGSPMPLEEFPVAQALGSRRVVNDLILGLRHPVDHRMVWVMCNAFPNLDAQGEPTEVVVSFTDITGLKQAERALSKSEERLSLMLRGANDAAWDWDLVADELYYSPRWWQMIGYAPGELPVDSQLWKRRMHAQDLRRVEAELGAHLAGDTASYEIEFRLQHSNGHYVPVLSRGFILRDPAGRPTRISGTNTDLTERKRSEQQIHRLAYYDPLTALPNRRLLMERLVALVGDTASGREHGAMLFIDLDNFKLLNDTMGHDVGDQLLKQVTRRLHACVRQRELLARLGGDEFVSMMEGLGHDADQAQRQAESAAHRIRDVLSLPYSLDGIDYRCTVSIGIALFARGERAADSTLKHADLAMHQAKAAGKNTLRVFDPAMQAAVDARLALEHDLRSDLQARRLQLHYQPQVDSAGETVSAEVLLRWHHPVRGNVPPDQFIPVAEATGLIVPLGEWVLDNACRQLAAWAADPRTAHLSLSVNASVRQLHDPGFVQSVLDILAATGADPTRLVIEVTESLFAENMEEVIARMARLRETGVRFSLDDFGTGYSSLSYLQRMPLDEIKIDRSFVQDITRSEHAATIARMIISLADNLHITVVAEGVETESQRVFLHDHGCRHYQGYLFSPALPLDAFEARLQQ